MMQQPLCDRASVFFTIAITVAIGCTAYAQEIGSSKQSDKQDTIVILQPLTRSDETPLVSQFEVALLVVPKKDGLKKAGEEITFTIVRSIRPDSKTVPANQVIKVRRIPGYTGSIDVSGPTILLGNWVEGGLKKFIFDRAVSKPQLNHSMLVTEKRDPKSQDKIQSKRQLVCTVLWPHSKIKEQYLSGRPKRGNAAQSEKEKRLIESKRLAHFVRYIEHNNGWIALDAYSELNAAKFELFKDVELPLETLRKVVEDKNVAEHRIALYGLLLGFCGNEDDSKRMERRILKTPKEFRLGIDGIMGGYLLIAGEKGLDVIERTKLRSRKIKNADGVEVEVPFSETYAAMNAVRILWDYGNGKISKDRLRASMRLLIEHEQIADLAIHNLRRWKDWQSLDRIVKVYDSEDPLPATKRAIIRFAYSCSRDGKNENGQLPAHAVKAQKHLDAFKKKK